MHDHGRPQHGDRRLIAAVALNVLLTIAQIVGGVISGSLSLIADSVHNLNDAGALVVALVARRVARRPADARRTFGYVRAEVIGALINLSALVLIGLYLLVEAAQRAFDPQPIDGWIVVWVAGAALVVDLGTAVLTFVLSKGNLNIRAAFVHNVSDALASIAVLVSGSLVLLFDWTWTDVAATLAIAVFVLHQGITLMRQAVRVLLEGVPPNLRLDDVREALARLPGVRGAHHLHVWQLDERSSALEAHLVVSGPPSEWIAIKEAARGMLRSRFDIEHSTLEFELPEEREHSSESSGTTHCHEAEVPEPCDRTKVR